MTATSATSANSAKKPGAASSAVMKVLNSVLSTRSLLARGLGQSFSGRRDTYETFGYAPDVTYENMLQRYKRQDIVSRIVNAYPDAVWTRPPQILGNEGLSAAFGELNREIGLYHYINRADRLSGIGKYAVLLLGFSDARETEALADPVRRSAGLKLNYVQAFGYGDAQIHDFETDPTSSSFGLPKSYVLITRGNEVARGGSVEEASSEKAVGTSIIVHRSRVLHLADCLLDNDIDGYPILERVYNRLDDVEKTVGGSAEMYWLSGRKGMHIDVDKDTQFTEENAEKLKAQLDDYMNDLQRTIRTRGVTIKDLGGQHINPEPVFNVIMSIISVATGIPQRIFIGSEQGKLASEQDRANWALRIDERRVLYAEPKVLRPMILRLQGLGVLPAGDYDLEWPEAFRMSPLERAQTAAQQARSATNIARAMTEYAKPIEGVDYSIRRPTATVSGGGGGGFGKGAPTFHAAKTPANSNDPAPAKAAPEKSGAGGSGDKAPGSAPAAPAPVVTPTEEIKIDRRELLTKDEARAIIYARGELKGEGKIDGVMD